MVITKQNLLKKCISDNQITNEMLYLNSNAGVARIKWQHNMTGNGNGS